MNIHLTIPPRFVDIINNWEQETYLVVGGYGSGKSYNAAALKIILKLFTEKRKCLVIRKTLASIKESCFEIIREILSDMNVLEYSGHGVANLSNKVLCRRGEYQFLFPNGSEIIFKGMDNPEKLKSIQGVSIVWIEEASEISMYEYSEITARLRTPGLMMHKILTSNPVSRENWIYRRWFAYRDKDDNKLNTIVDEKEFYEKKEFVKNGVYYHHSTCDDNPFLPKGYIETLEEIKTYDPILYQVARYGQFGVQTYRVLPQFEVIKDAKQFIDKVKSIPLRWHFFGMDTGFEESFNAVVSMAIDIETRDLYIYDELYVNHMTTDELAMQPMLLNIKKKQEKWTSEKRKFNFICCDSSSGSDIAYLRKQGYKIRPTTARFTGSRLQNTKKVKMFRHIYCSPKCRNTIAELQNLTYRRKKDGSYMFDKFNIDPHTLSAIWYALDSIVLSNPKDLIRNSYSPEMRHGYGRFKRGEQINNMGDYVFDDYIVIDNPSKRYSQEERPWTKYNRVKAGLEQGD